MNGKMDAREECDELVKNEAETAVEVERDGGVGVRVEEEVGRRIQDLPAGLT